jgi:hypothetical protein
MYWSTLTIAGSDRCVALFVCIVSIIVHCIGLHLVFKDFFFVVH